MRKIISIVVLALGLVFSVVPVATADVKPDPVPVAPKFTDPTCVPAIADVSHQLALSEDALRASRETVVAQDQAILALDGKIDRKNQVIARLRHRLHH